MALFLISSASGGPTPADVPKECDDKEQSKMQADFARCLDKFTKKHHEDTVKAKTAKEHQVRIKKAKKRSYYSSGYKTAVGRTPCVCLSNGACV